MGVPPLSSEPSLTIGTIHPPSEPGPGVQLAACLSKAEAKMLSDYLARATTVLEFGIGGSTVMAAKVPGLRLIGVDSHPDWITRCLQDPHVAAMQAEGRIRLSHVNIGPVKQWGYPRDRSHVRQWPHYARAIWKELDGWSPDFVFIDGRFRLSCAVQTLIRLPQVRHLCLHDFWSRPEYAALLDFVEVVDRIDDLGVFRPKPRLSFLQRYALRSLARKHIKDPR